jgi:alpha-mannosidase
MEEFRTPLTQLMCFYGVGNHVGGPTIQNIESIRRLNASPDFPTLRFSTPNRYFAAVAPCTGALPVVREDLQHHASGCYSAHSGIKRWNRRAENLLLAAEKFAAVAERATGQPYPCDLRRAWAGVLFNQFHDILAGTSLEAACDDARDLYGEASAIAGRALNNAIQSLSWNIAIPPEEGMTSSSSSARCARGRRCSTTRGAGCRCRRSPPGPRSTRAGRGSASWPTCPRSAIASTVW